MKRAVAIVNGASATIRLKLSHARAINANSNADEGGVFLAIAGVEDIAAGVSHVAALRVAAKVGLAVKLELAVPAVALDGEGAATARVEARAVTVGVGLIVDGLAVVADDREAVVVAGGAAAAVGTGNGAELAGGPDDAKVLGLGDGCGGCKAEEDVLEGRHYGFAVECVLVIVLGVDVVSQRSEAVDAAPFMSDPNTSHPHSFARSQSCALDATFLRV